MNFDPSGAAALAETVMPASKRRSQLASHFCSPSEIVPRPAPDMVKETLNWRTNVAVTARSPETTRLASPSPLEAPLHPPKREPASGWAASVTVAPSSKDAKHVTPQSMPAGVERTVPEPIFVTVRTCLPEGGGGPPSNAADTARSRSTRRSHAPLPEQAPPQPRKVEPDAATAARCSRAPSVTCSEQVSWQSRRGEAD